MAATQSDDSDQDTPQSFRERGLTFQQIPASWVQHGTIPPNDGQARHYATSVAINSRADELAVRYIHPANKWVGYRQFDIERVDGAVLPAVYVNEGASAFPLHFDASIDEYLFDAEDVYRQIEREWLWDRYDDVLSETLYQPDGTVDSQGGGGRAD